MRTENSSFHNSKSISPNKGKCYLGWGMSGVCFGWMCISIRWFMQWVWALFDWVAQEKFNGNLAKCVFAGVTWTHQGWVIGLRFPRFLQLVSHHKKRNSQNFLRCRGIIKLCCVSSGEQRADCPLLWEAQSCTQQNINRGKNMLTARARSRSIHYQNGFVIALTFSVSFTYNIQILQTETQSHMS